MRKTVTFVNGDNANVYSIDMEERTHFEREIIANFVSELVAITNKGLPKQTYSNDVYNTVLCAFEIKNIRFHTKIYLN